MAESSEVFEMSSKLISFYQVLFFILDVGRIEMALPTAPHVANPWWVAADWHSSWTESTKATFVQGMKRSLRETSNRRETMQKTFRNFDMRW